MGMHDCSKGNPTISGKMVHDGGATNSTRNWIGTELNGEVLDESIKSSIYSSEKEIDVFERRKKNNLTIRAKAYHTLMF